MATPGHYRLVVYKGDTHRWQFRLWHDLNKTQPVDLTGVTVSAQLRPYPSQEPCGYLDCVVSLPNVINATLPASRSDDVVNASWDLQLIYPSGDVFTALYGPVTTTPDITR